MIRRCVLLLSCLLPSMALAQAVQPVQLELQTTSDDVQIDFSGLDVRVLHSDVASINGAAQVGGRPLHVKKQPWDRTPMTLRAELLVTPTDAPLALKVTRGCPGQVHVTLRAAGKIALQQTWPDDTPPQEKQRALGKADTRKKEEDRGPKELTAPLRADALLVGKPLPRKAFTPMVLAYHYVWYSRPEGPAKEWSHWNPKRADHDSTHTPALGYYDSADPKITARQIALAQEAGIDGFIVSWWASAWDRLCLAEMLRQADAAHFAISLYLEAAPTPQEFHKQLQEVEALAKGHPSFLRVEGKPVAFLYGRILYALGHAGMREGLKDTNVFCIGDALAPETFSVLDGAGWYMALDVPDQQRENLVNLQRTSRLHDKLLVASVAPGYDDTHIRSPGRVDQRLDGQFYESMWAAAKLADWVVITSWNEWHEGSDIEPSVEFGRKYIDLTRKLVKRWHQ